MNSIFDKIKREWERTLMTLVLFTVLVCLGCLAYKMMNGDSSSGSEKNKFRTPHAYFDVASREYMNSPALDRKTRSALAYRLKLKIPPAKPQPPKPQTTQQQPKQQQPKQQPAKPQPPKQQATKPKPPKQPPPVTITVKYRGCMQLADDAPVAFCTSSSSKDKKSMPASLHKGDKVHSIILIEEFDANEIKLSYNGQKISLPKGKEHIFTVE